MKWSLGRTEAVTFIGGILVVAVINVVSYVSTTRLIAAGDRVTHTYQVLEKLEEVRSDLNDAVTDQRNYIVTGREAFLGTYRMALAELRRDVNDLRALTADNPEQQRRLDELGPTIEDTAAELTGTVEALKAQGFGAAQARIHGGRGTRLMEAVRESINTMRHAEEALAKERSHAAEARAKATLAAVTTGSVLALLALLLAMHRINGDVWRRRKAEGALREAYNTLDVRVEQRTADLALANAELRREIAERRQAEERIREQAALLDVARDAITVRDLEDRIRFWSKGAERMYGWTAEEALGSDATLLLKGDSPQFNGPGEPSSRTGAGSAS